jgi:hypothetical protein
MVQGHLDELRAIVEQAKDLPEETRTKLLRITAELERDAAEAEAASSEDSSDTAEGATATDGEGGSSGLVSAIEGLEASHPEVTATVSNVARMLSKLGF